MASPTLVILLEDLAVPRMALYVAFIAEGHHQAELGSIWTIHSKTLGQSAFSSYVKLSSSKNFPVSSAFRLHNLMADAMPYAMPWATQTINLQPFKLLTGR